MLQGGATGSKTIDLKHSASHRNLQVKLLSVYSLAEKGFSQVW